MTALDRYLASSERAGLVLELHGFPAVVGELCDPSWPGSQYLIEYCAPELIEQPELLDSLRAAVLSGCSPPTRLLCRAPVAAVLPAPWAVHQTYLIRHTVPGTEPTKATPGVQVHPAGDANAAELRRWLRQALEAAMLEWQQPTTVEALDIAVERLMEDPQRISLIATRGPVALGHATLLLGCRDDVTGTDFIELIDVLSRAGDASSQVSRQLVDAAQDYAGQRGLPLMGHVVHPRDLGSGKAARILATLGAAGWMAHHAIWAVTAEPTPAQP